jgi:hypothetical protein
MTGLGLWLVAGGLVSALTAIGAGIWWFYNQAYSAGKKSAKLDVAKKELENARKTGEIMGKQLPPSEIADSLDSGKF